MNAAKPINEIFIRQWTKIALITDQRSFSYSEIYGYINAIQILLSLKGCKFGDTVALRLPNGWPFALAYFACILGGYRMVPVNIELNQDDQDFILDLVKPSIVLDDETVLSNLDPVPADIPNFNFSKGYVSAIFFSSGTTGKLKGVCHTLDSLVENALAFNKNQVQSSNIVLYHILPMAYVAGFLNTLLSPWLAGGTIVLGPRFRSSELFQFWKRPLKFDVNTIWVTPTIASALVSMNRDPDISSKLHSKIKHIFCATAPLSILTRKSFFDTFGVYLQESYGLSELLLISTQTLSEASSKNNVGIPMPGIHVSLDFNKEFNENELVIRTPFALTNYLVEEGEYSPLLKDGGMPTGDFGAIIDDAITITGRLKNLIIRGGLNISPVHIENVLIQEPGVEEVCVIGYPDDFWGEKIVACVVANSNFDKNMLQINLIQHCIKKLNEGSRPDHYVWLEKFPKTPTGKIKKYLLLKDINKLF